MYMMLIFICLIALLVLVVNIVVVKDEDTRLLRYICIALFLFSMTRYVALIVYGDMPTLAQLERLRYFYFATAIGLAMTTASAVWAITPFLNKRISYVKYLLYFTPWILFYVYVIIAQPTEIVKGNRYGYILQLVGEFPKYLSIVQGSFVVIMIMLCIIGMIKYKNEVLRSKYFVLIAAQILLTIDGIGYWRPLMSMFAPFTVTEVLGFLAICYAFYERKIRIS